MSGTEGREEGLGVEVGGEEGGAGKWFREGEVVGSGGGIGDRRGAGERARWELGRLLVVCGRGVRGGVLTSKWAAMVLWDCQR